MALFTLLYNKKKQSLIIENFENNFKKAKTNYFLKICQNCQINIKQRLLIIVLKKTKEIKLSLRNLKNIELICVSNINTLSILKANQIIISNSALNYLKESFK